MKFFIKDFFSNCNQIRGFGHIYWINLYLKTSFFVQWMQRATFGFKNFSLLSRVPNQSRLYLKNQANSLRFCLILAPLYSLFSFHLQVTVWKVFVFGVFLVRIFPHSDWIQRDTEYLSLLSLKARKCRSKKLRTWTLFMQWVFLISVLFFEKFALVKVEFLNQIRAKIQFYLITYLHLRSWWCFKKLVTLAEGII